MTKFATVSAATAMPISAEALQADMVFEPTSETEQLFRTWLAAYLHEQEALARLTAIDDDDIVHYEETVLDQRCSTTHEALRALLSTKSTSCRDVTMKTAALVSIGCQDVLSQSDANNLFTEALEALGFDAVSILASSVC